MKRAAISKLKAMLSEYIAWVKGGEDVLVTDRGKPVARIVPIPPGAVADDRIRDLVSRGVVRTGTGGLRSILSTLPACEVAEGAVSRALDEDRRE